MPPEQNFEQHWLPLVQKSPLVLHVPLLIGAQAPLVHLPVQHCELVEQVVPSARHADAWHCWLRPQTPEQQSVFFEHVAALPVGMHGPLGLAHWLAVKRPQLSPVGQLPHDHKPPHPSGWKPQVKPLHAVAWGVCVHWLLPPHWLATPFAPQTSGDGQLPHWMTPPQPSAIGPQKLSGQLVMGVQVLPGPPSPATEPPPHTLARPPPPQI